MKLYYAPGACSLACRISLHEAGIASDFERVDLRSKVTEHGYDYRAINPKGSVPMLVLDEGAAVTEALAVLLLIADREPALEPGGPLGRTRLIEMLSFLSTELHIAFKPYFHDSSDAEREAARAAVLKRLNIVANRMRGPYLFGNSFGVADAYLFVMLRWARNHDIELPRRLVELFDRVSAREAVRQSIGEEEPSLVVA